MEFTLPYGHDHQTVGLSDTANISLLDQTDETVSRPANELISAALENPIDAPLLAECVSGAEGVVVVTSDITRPCPSHMLLPPVIEAISSAGITDEQITVVLGIGSHRPHTETERRSLVGEEVLSRVSVVDSDPADVVPLGHTKAGTPVEITRRLVEADATIVLGNIEYHYFVGYSGGLKAIVPGCASERTISANHSMMTHLNAVAAALDGNPVRMDLEEAAQFIKVDFMLNALLDSNKNIIKVVAGNPITAHREGCRFLDEHNQARINSKANVAIASPGGYPKDINLYQAQKGLDNAAQAVADGGMLILVAECSDGIGHGVFGQWLCEAPDPAACLARLEQGFVLGGHKAAAIARVMQRVYQVALVSELPEDLVREMGFMPYPDAQSAIEQALACYGSDTTVVVMPHAASTLPILTK